MKLIAFAALIALGACSEFTEERAATAAAIIAAANANGIDPIQVSADTLRGACKLLINSARIDAETLGYCNAVVDALGEVDA